MTKKRTFTLELPVKLNNTQKFIIKGYLTVDIQLVVNNYPDNIIIPSINMILKRCNNKVFQDSINEYEFGSLVELHSLNEFKQYFTRMLYDKWISVDNPDIVEESFIYSTMKENIDKISNFIYEHKKYFK